MRTTAPVVPTRSAPVISRPVARAVLLAGPVATAWFITDRLVGGPSAGQLGVALTVMVVALWSPAPMMLPSLLLQDAHTEAGHGPWAAPWKVFRSLLAPMSSVRTEAALALTGWLFGLAAVVGILTR